MTVHRRHVWTLDDAALDPGVVISGAGGGLPRRITPAMDYSERVLALSPSGYWRVNIATGALDDLTANSRDLTAAGSVRSAVAGHGFGGDAANANYWDGITASAAAVYPEHTFTVGQPFSLLCWMTILPSSLANSFYYWLAYSKYLITTRNGLTGTTAGWSFGAEASFHRFIFSVGNGSVECQVQGRTYEALLDGKPIPVVVTYNGGATNLLASWAFYARGSGYYYDLSPASVMANGAITNGEVFKIRTPTQNCLIHWQDVAIWNNRCLTADEVAHLSDHTHVGKARFSHTFDKNATVRGVLLPGDTIVKTPAAARKERQLYLSTDGGATRTEVEPGADPSYAVTAGQTLTTDVEFTHYQGQVLPFVGDAAGGGPTLVYEEPDPPSKPALIHGGFDLT